MKKLLAIALAAVTLSGCIKEEEKGIGVVPLEGAKVSGKIVDVFWEAHSRNECDRNGSRR